MEREDQEELSLREKNPAFARLVDILNSGYLHYGLLKETASRLQLAESRLQSVKQSYMEKLVPYSSLADSLEAHRSRGSMAAAELQHCRCLSPQQTPLGVQPEHLKAVAQVSSSKVSIRQDVEERLKQKCLKLSEWYGRQQEPEDLQLAKSSQLPQLLRQEIQEMAVMDDQLHNTKCERFKKLHTKWKFLVEMCSELKAVLEQYKLGSGAEADRVTMSHLHTRCQAMLGKLEVMHYQLLKGICSEGRLQALQELKSHLVVGRRAIEERLSQTRQTLQHYQSYGQEFVSVANQYREVLAEIENKQWALTELGKTNT